MKQSKISIIFLCIVSFLVTSCASDIQSNAYDSASVGEASFTYQGVVISARKVVVRPESLEKNQTGIGVGALAGGVAGNQFGKGGGNLAATVGGAVLGGVAGAFAERKLKTQEAMEYTVKLTNGQILTTVQGLDNILQIGQAVMVITSHNGRSRIIPDNSGTQAVQAPVPTPSVRINKHR
ncbi:MAG: hypothetical protein K0R02_66 [Rickettsiaceae bacterium]|jgi:outer membrane lipoprotein SlyB|nr:hypothetical protein [Rickettsiaceae bacterium]